MILQIILSEMQNLQGIDMRDDIIWKYSLKIYGRPEYALRL